MGDIQELCYLQLFCKSKIIPKKKVYFFKKQIRMQVINHNEISPHTIKKKNKRERERFYYKNKNK